MYAPHRYRPTRETDVWQVVTDHPFATLCVTADTEFEIAHVPLVPEETPAGHRRLLGHVAVRNPVRRLLGRPGVRAVAVFHGPNGYLSPNDYVTDGNLPTWNYVVAHISGTLHPLSDDRRLDQLARLAAIGERHRGGTRREPWTLAHAPAGLMADLLPHIVFFALTVTRVEGVFKLSQGRTSGDLDAQVAALRSREETPPARALADLMATVW